VNWFDWTLLQKHPHLHRFVKLLMARRLLRATEHEHQRISLNQLIQGATKAWHGVRLHHPDWGDHSHSLALAVELRPERLPMHLILNTYWEPLEFQLPPLHTSAASHWRRWIDTALDTPDDIVPWREAPAVSGFIYRAQPRSVVVLYAPGV